MYYGCTQMQIEFTNSPQWRDNFIFIVGLYRAGGKSLNVD